MDMKMSEIRTSADDSDGVKHLKEVMQNIARLHKEAVSPQAKAEGWGILQGEDRRHAQPEKDEKVEKPKKTEEDGASYNLAQLGANVEDDVCADLAGDEQQGSLLRGCGSRVNGLCSRLQALESHVPRAPLAYDTTASGIRIVDRPEQAASAQRALADRAAAEDIARHAKFPPLDVLDETISKCKDYKDLRAQFHQRHHHNPRIFFLTDFALTDNRHFRAAIWNTEGEVKVSSRMARQRSGSATPLRGSGPVAAKQSLQAARKSRFRRDQSAPHFGH
mmetsp:Transcript_78557/g.168334  ORF Transcript_78557/g.168334 Transcript_78557/m.168334 type:complete len:277 (-) Transcript_78557:46-876(-)